MQKLILPRWAPSSVKVLILLDISVFSRSLGGFLISGCLQDFLTILINLFTSVGNLLYW